MRTLIKDLLNDSFYRFILVSILNTAFGYTIFSLFIYFKTNYKVAIALATIAGIIFNYQSIGKLVFRHKETNRIIRFIFAYIFIYLLNINGVSLFLSLGFNLYISFVMIFVPTSLINYLVMKAFVFKK